MCALLQTRLQAGNGYKNTLHCIVSIYKKENVRPFVSARLATVQRLTLILNT